MSLPRRTARLARKTVRTGRRWLLGQFFGTVIGVDVHRPLVALTFDDGPDPVTTPKVLDVLERHGAHATFFMVGRRAQAYPELVARVAAGGHVIGHHTMDHLSMVGLGRSARHDQIRGGFDAIGPACSHLFRPPYGHLDLPVWWSARREGHRVVAWSNHPFDWTRQPLDRLTDRLRDCLEPGAIVLLHDAPQPEEADSERPRAALLSALTTVLASADPNWRFVTVPELLAAGRPRLRMRWYRPSDA